MGMVVGSGPYKKGNGSEPPPDHPNNDMDTDTARSEQALWEANTKVYANQQNVLRAVVNALNSAVPKSY